MKKLFLFFVAVLMVSMTANAITINKALLQHNGEVTLFEGSNIQDAVNAAVDGDTIYLTLGTFKPFTINKKITVRGTGEKSIINGDVTINIPGTQNLTSTILEALAVTGSVTLSSNVTNLTLHKCKILGALSLSGNVTEGNIKKCKIGTMTFGGSIDNLFVDRCYITSKLTLSPTITGMTVVNTKLYSLNANQNATNNTTFVNCNIYDLYAGNYAGTIINSIIQRYANTETTINSTVLLNTVINTYYLSIGSSSVTQNCYYVNNTRTYVTSSCECTPNSSFVGTDGTIVGIYGGDTPYSEEEMLVPSVPKVTSSDLDLDNENKVLNVKLTVSPQ